MNFRDRFGYIESWTSARWVRERNPYFGLQLDLQTGKYVPVPVGTVLYPYGTVRRTPITGEWVPINGEYLT